MKYRADIEDAEDRGEAKGEAKKADEMIRSFKALGVPLETIAQASKMPLDYIQNLSL